MHFTAIHKKDVGQALIEPEESSTCAKLISPRQDQATRPMAKEFLPDGNNRSCLWEEAAYGKLNPFTLETAAGKAEYGQMPFLSTCMIKACFKLSIHITSHHNTHKYSSRIEGVLSAIQATADTSMPHAHAYMNLHCLFAKLSNYVDVEALHRTRCCSHTAAPLPSVLHNILPVCQSTVFNYGKTDTLTPLHCKFLLLRRGFKME